MFFGRNEECGLRCVYHGWKFDADGNCTDLPSEPAGSPLQAKEDLVREKQPMLDYTTPEKIGALAVFLCGEAASTITGAALSIDGGWVAQ